MSSFCYTYEPVYHSKKDTEETKLQIDRNNAKYLALCEKEGQHKTYRHKTD